MALSKGIPGGYEDFSYQEAKKVAEDIKRQETYVMKKLKIGLAQRLLDNGAHEELERQMEAEELDEIFKLDFDEAGYGSQSQCSSTTRQMTSGVNSEEQLENVEEGYESNRRNDVEEDARIAQTIIQGVAEYTEFKV